MSVFDGRKHQRQASDAVEVVWLIEGQQSAGKGRLIDVSLTGICVEISSTALQCRTDVTFSLHIPQIASAPARARLRWYRRIESHDTVFLCGLVFLRPYAQAWLDWVSAYIGEQEARANDPRPVTVAEIVAILKDARPPKPPAPAAPQKPGRFWGLIRKS